MSSNTILLAKIAALGGVTVSFSGYLFKRSIENNLRKSEYYTESFRILRSNKGIEQYLGSPIREGKIDLGDTNNNYCTGKEAKFQIPVKGSKKKGTFFISASREEFGDSWNVQRLELSVEDIQRKRILVFDRENKDI